MKNITFNDTTYPLEKSTFRPSDIEALLAPATAGNAAFLAYADEHISIIVIEKEQPSQAFRYCRNDYDKGRLLFARQYITDHVTMPPSIPELARIAGINEFKLKNGFRELFGHTVYGYLNAYRMEKAKVWLLENKKNVSQIAFELGFSSLQHFSAAFKKAFGCSPKKIKSASSSQDKE
jgi:AraC-like DNA-binding protein